MKKIADNTILNEPIKQKRLSVFRLSISIFVLAGLIYLSFSYIQYLQSEQVAGNNKAWFAAYVDVTAVPQFPFQQMGTTSNKDAILSFIVSSPSNACTPSWGGTYTLNQAENVLNLDTRIARLQEQGGSVAISFGGEKNNELAINCTNPTKLLNAYTQVVNRYNINTIDLDIEGSALSNTQAGVRRAIAIATLQKERLKAGKNFAVWVTLPVTPQGLTQQGTNAVAQLLKYGVDLSGVNVMTMDYGSSFISGENMLTVSESALTQTQRQLGILYQRAGIYLNNATLWSKIGATPMIGQNNYNNEVFTLANAKGLNQFALQNGLGRMSMWSANRDITCGSNYVDVKIVSDACSGVKQGTQSFSQILGKGFNGSISLSSGFITTSSAISKSLNTPDNPATSPYQIWSPNGAYLEGTKVVWAHNIYEAKWWTQGNIPNDPVLQSWQTPWVLIGPVLPGEKPIPQATLPQGTYPNWSGIKIYNTGVRVLFNGVPYQAKWWNQGDSPAAASSDATGSPWTPLTQAQINSIEAKIKG